MARRLVWLVLAWLVLVVAAAGAKDIVATVDPAPPEAVARFLMGTRLGYITCSGKHRAYLEQLDLYDLVNQGRANPRMTLPSNEEATACVHATTYKGKGLYDAAAKHASSPSAKSALREYMTAWQASLIDLSSKPTEKPREFDARQKKQEARLDELQKRVETTAK
jgi:hypothetical protein